MLVIMWTVGRDNNMLSVHFQQAIGALESCQGEWALGPASGEYLVPISEGFALTLINRADAVMEVHHE